MQMIYGQLRKQTELKKARADATEKLVDKIYELGKTYEGAMDGLWQFGMVATDIRQKRDDLEAQKKSLAEAEAEVAVLKLSLENARRELEEERRSLGLQARPAKEGEGSGKGREEVGDEEMKTAEESTQ
jgi:DNA repair ATPase RecN